jgi:hypothetical protein
MPVMRVMNDDLVLRYHSSKSYHRRIPWETARAASPLTMTSSPVTLLDLPNELLLEIMRSLGYASRLHISQSCSFFRARVAGVTPLTLQKKLLYLHEVEEWPKWVPSPAELQLLISLRLNITETFISRNTKYFSCYKCLKLRRRRRFDDTQVQQEREKGGSESDRRFCVDYGIKRGIYELYNRIDIEGLTYFVCRICNNICGLGFDCGICYSGHYCFSPRQCSIQIAQTLWLLLSNFQRKICAHFARDFVKDKKVWILKRLGLIHLLQLLGSNLPKKADFNWEVNRYLSQDDHIDFRSYVAPARAYYQLSRFLTWISHVACLLPSFLSLLVRYIILDFFFFTLLIHMLRLNQLSSVIPHHRHTVPILHCSPESCPCGEIRDDHWSTFHASHRPALVLA